MDKKFEKLYLVPPLPPDNCGGGGGDDSSYPKRINVAVNADMVDAIREVIVGQGVELTEAVRRLVMVGHAVMHAVTDEDSRILLERPDGRTQELLLVEPDS